MARKFGISFMILLVVVILIWLIGQVQKTEGDNIPTQEALASPPDFVGWVLEVDIKNGQIKVESQADKIVRPATVTLTEETVIFRRENGVLRQVDISEVYLQDQAELWLIGPVPSVFPAEVTVRQITVDRLD